MSYEILGSFSTEDLAGQVNRKIEEGWEPVGGLHSVTKALTDEKCGHFLMQAIFKPKQIKISTIGKGDEK